LREDSELPGVRVRELLAPLGCTASKTIVDDYLREVRPLFAPPARVFQRTVYERASLIVTSNKPFSGWGEIFGDDVVVAAMIDRLVHHAEILALKGDSYRLRDRDLGRPARDD
jgi:hypothetical protein